MDGISILENVNVKKFYASVEQRHTAFIFLFFAIFLANEHIESYNTRIISFESISLMNSL